nr:flagellar protein FlgN [uncultured Tolumonas sp.]
MKRDEISRALLSELHYELKAYQRLMNIMLEQHRLMATHQSAALTELNVREQQLLAVLRQQAQRRSQLLRVIGFNASEQGMKQFLAELPPSLLERVEPVWNKIYQQLRLCKAQNELNGRLLASQHDLLNRLLFGEPDPDYASLA